MENIYHYCDNKKLLSLLFSSIVNTTWDNPSSSDKTQNILKRSMKPVIGHKNTQKENLRLFER